MTDLEHARRILEQDGYTCVLCKGARILHDTRRGIKPLLELLDCGEDLREFSAADKVVGKAAAHLYHLMGVREIYADVISEPAKAVLEARGIGVGFGKCVPCIQNRTQTGLCPMESAVWSISDSRDALQAIRTTLESL